jgi:hypothetical protein
MSTISRIRARVEAQVAARLIPRLIDRGVDYHCRKKLRRWCDCNYCRTKIKGSWEIGWVGQDFSLSNPYPGYDNWEVWSRIKAVRLKKIEALRLKLKSVKEEPICGR